MTVRRSLYISFAVHLLIFGSAIALTRYAGGASASLSSAIQVTLASSAPEFVQGTGISAPRQPRRYQTPSQPPEPPVDRQPADAEDGAVDRGSSSLTPAEENGNREQITDNSDGGGGGHMITSAIADNGIHRGFSLITPEQWSAIESAIQRTKSYPRLARERGIEGVVRLRFRLSQEGSIDKIEIIESSGSEILDKASVRAVHRAAPMPAVTGWVEMPMRYVLK